MRVADGTLRVDVRAIARDAEQREQEADRARSEQLAQRADDVADRLRAATAGLEDAWRQYRERVDGTGRRRRRRG